MSAHMPVGDLLRIIGEKVFDALTISCSLLNYNTMEPVLDYAREMRTGIVIMNPLGGGIIPTNPQYFGFSKNENEDNVNIASLRFLSAHPAVNVILSGISNKQQLHENISAFTKTNIEPPEKRIARVKAHMVNFSGFCVGCGYCVDCPSGIPVPDIMQSRNIFLFHENKDSIEFCRRLYGMFGYIPHSDNNPCIKCGLCDKRCTQKINVSDDIADSYKRMGVGGYSISSHRNRLYSLIHKKSYSKVAFYPAGATTIYIIEEYKRFFCQPSFEIDLYDTNPDMWGTEQGGYRIYSPKDIRSNMPDCIIISNFKWQNEIFEQLKECEISEIPIIKFFSESDVPWVF
jgi:ferredoxin